MLRPDGYGGSPVFSSGLLRISAALACLSPAALADGAALYSEHCAVCHQVDGSGVPFTQPELILSPKLNGDKALTIDMLLLGSDAVKPGTSDYSNRMPAFAVLSDKDLAELATYIRSHFDNSGNAVSAADVSARRDITGAGGSGR